jgi:hypothetical protein
MNQSLLNISFPFLVRFKYSVVVWWRVENGGENGDKNAHFGDIFLLVGCTS